MHRSCIDYIGLIVIIAILVLTSDEPIHKFDILSLNPWAVLLRILLLQVHTNVMMVVIIIISLQAAFYGVYMLIYWGFCVLWQEVFFFERIFNATTFDRTTAGDVAVCDTTAIII